MTRPNLIRDALGVIALAVMFAAALSLPYLAWGVM